MNTPCEEHYINQLISPLGSLCLHLLGARMPIREAIILKLVIDSQHMQLIICVIQSEHKWIYFVVNNNTTFLPLLCLSHVHEQLSVLTPQSHDYTRSQLWLPAKMPAGEKLPEAPLWSYHDTEGKVKCTLSTKSTNFISRTAPRRMLNYMAPKVLKDYIFYLHFKK